MTTFQRKQLDLMRQMEASLASGSNASTIVPFQKDYVTDRQLCLSVNTFIPKKVATTIQTNLIMPLKAIDPRHYYYGNEALHVPPMSSLSKLMPEHTPQKSGF